ncbi:MAG: hypothetical protein F6J90_30220 [Moorea sp. SIOASIH]|uniref:hypothetical protein n=1 Tax=Moorena sp. SIOASIH TaxID=2607817 RepID=UPI0013B7CE06|nr:hypothetical protein [Moorena sp. SIOASIH]NEO40388.1 hypothetical protein [Moorena sp. SIOASIH]
MPVSFSASQDAHPERQCWDSHVGGTGMLVERASCPCHFQPGRMPTLVERACWWNGHLARVIFSQAGCPPHC